MQCFYRYMVVTTGKYIFFKLFFVHNISILNLRRCIDHTYFNTHLKYELTHKLVQNNN